MKLRTLKSQILMPFFHICSQSREIKTRKILSRQIAKVSTNWKEEKNETKRGTDRQTWKRFKLIAIVVFENL